jgi:hypothetical protein
VELVMSSPGAPILGSDPVAPAVPAPVAPAGRGSGQEPPRFGAVAAQRLSFPGCPPGRILHQILSPHGEDDGLAKEREAG